MTCSLISGPASQAAINGLNTIQNYANNAINNVNVGITALQSFTSLLTPVGVDVELEDAGNLSSAFQMDNIPALPNVQLGDVAYPDYPSIAGLYFNRTVSAPSDFTEPTPSIAPPERPDALSAEMPTDRPFIVERTMPDVPSDTIPSVPDLFPIGHPVVPQLDLPEFTATAPSDLVEDSIGVFDWTEETYSPTIRTEEVEQLQAILGGSTGIPDAIWDMIESRMRRQIRAVAIQSREEATDYWASRGHFLSNGQLRKRTKEAADTEREGVSEVVRELAIQDSKIYVERLNNALAQGIALEDQLIRLHNSRMDRSLKAAQTIYDIMVKVAELKITVYNARMAAYFQEAQVFQINMNGELAKLEKTKAEIEIEKLNGQLNLQKLEAYKAEVAGVTAVYDLYKTQVGAVVAKYEGDKALVLAFSESVKAYGAQVGAWEAEWRGYGEAVKAEVSKVNAFKVQSDVYLSRVQAYKTGVEADRLEFDSDLEAEKFKITEFQTQLEGFKAQLQGEIAELDALVKAYDTEARTYEAQGRIENSRVESDTQRFRALVENARVRAEVEFKELDRQIEQANQLYTFQYKAIDTSVQVNSQVGSSALAALNYAATISDDISNSTTCNTTYAY